MLTSLGKITECSNPETFLSDRNCFKARGKDVLFGEFPGSPVVRTPRRSHCQGPGFDPDRRSRIPRASRYGKKKIKKQDALFDGIGKEWVGG